MTAPVTLRVLSILQELMKKSRQMSSQDFGPLRGLANTPTLTTYDIDLEAQTYSCRR